MGVQFTIQGRVQFSIRGLNIPWMKIDPGVNLPWGSKYHMTPAFSETKIFLNCPKPIFHELPGASLYKVNKWLLVVPI
jgi:hypothetical protein